MKLSTLKLALLSATVASGILAPQAFAKPVTDAEKAQILKLVDADAANIKDAALKIWGFAEVGYQETKSTAVLQEQLKAAGFETIGGNAVKPEVLLKAGLDKATHLFVAVPSPFEAARIIEQARAANPDCAIVARAYTDADVLLLKQMGATDALIGEDEIAKGMLARAPKKKPAAATHH